VDFAKLRDVLNGRSGEPSTTWSRANHGVHRPVMHDATPGLPSTLGLATPARVNTNTLPASEITALLGRGTRFEGKLLFDGRIRIDGVFKGVIRSDDTLVIGEGAEVDAEVDVANVIIRGGVVRGTIRARSSIELYVPAHVTASLHAPSVFIDKGVHFEGTCKMAELEDPGQGGAMPRADDFDPSDDA
jgi:cytoskeletal protein CcmA (bactofilin family)